MKYKPINDYTTMYDLFQKLGIKEYKPKIGNVGRAIMEASKNHRSIGWLKNQLDTYFNKLRQNKGKDKTHVQKQNSRHNLRPNAKNHS